MESIADLTVDQTMQFFLLHINLVVRKRVVPLRKGVMKKINTESTDAKYIMGDI